jgi:hypothetical protein
MKIREKIQRSKKKEIEGQRERERIPSSKMGRV